MLERCPKCDSDNLGCDVVLDDVDREQVFYMCRNCGNDYHSHTTLKPDYDDDQD